VKLAGSNPWHAALGAQQGADTPTPYGFALDGSWQGHKAAWLCPLCSHPGQTLIVVLDGTDAPRCFNCDCSADALRQALGDYPVAKPSRGGGPSVALRVVPGSDGAVADIGRTTTRRGRDVLPMSHVLPMSELKTWGKLRPAVEAFSARCLGASVPLGQSFPCRLPNHSGRASFYADPLTGTWKYGCWCRGQVQHLTVAEVCLSLACGRVTMLTSGAKSERNGDHTQPPAGNTQAATWYLRAWYEAGLIEPLDIELPAAPPGSCEVVATVRDGFRLLVGLRWLRYPGQPVAYGRNFIPAWCGADLHPMAAYRALAELEAAGVVKWARHYPVPGKRPGSLWLPGETGETT
jgi:hypothetical protein